MPNNSATGLVLLDQASRLLEEAQSLDEIKSIRDKAEAARTYVKAAQFGLDLQNRAAEVKLRAERKAGEFLQSMKLRGGDRKSKLHHVTLKLEELGISRQQSMKWQQVASVSEEAFHRYLKETNEQRREVSSAGLLRLAKKPAKLRADRSRTRQPVAEPDEMLVELLNHCHLLGDVLRPICDTATSELKRGERRIVGQLIHEMIDLIQQLRRHWPRST